MARPQKFNEQQVLSKAMIYFWRHGYSASSIQELLDEMGISRGTLYNAIGDKDALFKRTLELFHSKEEQLLELTLFNDALSPGERAEKFIRLSFSEHGSLPTGCYLVNTLCEDDRVLGDVKEIVNHALQRMEDGFRSLFDAHFQDQTLARTYAALMATQVRGSRIRQREGGDNKMLVNDLLCLLETLLKAH
ncbi:TetR/AcrR family transcriptional regulator [Litoribrevibacter euphylliae]|uniref:TetR/AcrR family transcriptional regulator n=1 Tax=Litoribrevibacter euphylliae TaxID=1834034 RepID=A0ABV7HBG0_9GAMM